MNREAIDTWCKRAILLLVSAILVFTPLALGGVRPSEFVVVQWLTIGVVAIWLLRVWLAPKYRFLLPPSSWAALVFVGYAVWRYLAADIEYLARQEFLLVVVAAILLLAIVDNLHGQSELRILAIVLITVATLVAMYGIFQWLTGSQKVWHFVRPGYEGRASGSYISPNHLAGFLGMVVPIAILFAMFRGFGAVPRILFAYAALVILVGIAATGSRGGWLSTAIAVLVLGGVLIRRKGQLWAALAMLLIVGTTGTWLYSRAVKDRVEHHAQTPVADDLRVRLWGVALKMWKDHLWVGVGPDHFDVRYRGYRPAHWQFQPRPDRAHNDYINTLADWGLTGLLLVLVPVGVTGFGTFYTWRYLQRRGETAGTRAAVVLGSSIGLTSVLIHSFFDFNMHIPANALLAATLVGLITSHWRFASQRFWLTARVPVQIAATLVLAGTGAYLFLETQLRTQEVLVTRRAEALAAASAERIAALKEAFGIDPRNGATAYEVGEQLRLRAWAGESDYRDLALEAISWFEKAAKLNKWDPYPLLRTGMCLDWLEDYGKAEAYFRAALKLDPNHWYTRAMLGWHFFQAENYAEVTPWMKRSLELQAHDNPLAYNYLALTEKIVAEGAGRSNSLNGVQRPLERR